MPYPQADYDYLAAYPNTYPQQIAQLCKDVDGHLAVIFAEGANYKAAAIQLLQFWVDEIPEDGTQFPDNAMNVINGYSGPNQQQFYEAGLYPSQSGQVAQCIFMDTYRDQILSLFNYWIAA